MTILHLNDHLASVGGVETYLLSLVPHLEGAGHTVQVGYGSGEEGLVANGRMVPELRSIRFREVAAGRELVSGLMRTSGAEVVHVHGIQNLGAIQAAVESGRAVLHGHDYRPVCPASNFFFKRSKTICARTCGPGCFGTTLIRHCMTPRPWPAAYFYRRVRWIARHAANFRRVIAPSRAARDRYVAAGFGPEQVVVLPYFCPLPPRHTPRVRPVVPTITFMGRASYNKGWEVFVEALGLLPPSVRGLMVGNFGNEGDGGIARLAAKHGCADRLSVEGWAGREAVTEVYVRTSVFVFPSLWPETMGIVGVEALSQGVPVVASDVGGVREWLEDGVNGIAVPPGDPGAVARAVGRIMDEREGRSLEDWGAKGIETVQEKFSMREHLDRLMRIYEEVAGA